MMTDRPAKIVTRLTTQRKGRRGRRLASYVVLQLINREFLLVDRGLDEVADRYEPNHAAVLDDGEVPAAALRHERHAFLDRAARRNANDVRRHDRAHGGVPRRAAHERHFARVVALAEDTQ